MAMIFPPDSVYTSNSYRIPVADLTAYATVSTHRNLPGRGEDEDFRFFSGAFHKDRLFGHFATFAEFTYNNDGTYTISRLQDNFNSDTYNDAYPIFWRNAGRKNGLNNKPFGYAHHFAEVGSSTSGSLVGIFSRNGRQPSNTSGAVETILDVADKNSSGFYFITSPSRFPTYDGKIAASRTPFHPRYNVSSQRHDYPRALYSDEPNFKILDGNGVELNPLSSASTRGSRAGFKFSVFRHYGQFSVRNNNVVSITRPASPAVNPAAIAQGGWGHDYLVSNTRPISRRNWQTRLDRILVYSPYNDATTLDFLNGVKYNDTLAKSSIWSK